MGGISARWLAWLLLLGIRLPVFGQADVVLLRTAIDGSADEQAIRHVSTFYGLDLEAVNVDSPNGRRLAFSDVRNPRALAAFISANALRRLDPNQMHAALLRPNGSHIPILIFGIESGATHRELQLWSSGVIRDCAPVEATYEARTLNVQKLGNLTGALGGSGLMAVSSPSCRLLFEDAPNLQTVLSTDSDNDGSGPAVLLRIRRGDNEVFFSPQMRLLAEPRNGGAETLTSTFSVLAEYILFLSHAAGSRAWHLDGHYANFTIDDPWLTQPYGNLDYEALLAEMDKHNFHTTIAFIPWNFDRSDRRIVSLFLKRPERFSICMHGNNHSHQEFGDYQRNPLSQQINDVKQGIARMERFHRLTTIPYDRFMVFPHAVAPEATFRVLTSYGFSGTANSSNVPMNTDPPNDLGFLLRPSPSAYGGLLSLSRHPVLRDIPRSRLAIESFFGTPMLFYAHENLFESGSGAFNPIADVVNHFQPDIRWTSLGEIARHSHLICGRFDGDFDVLMFSSEMDLVNPDQEEREFFVTKAGESLDASLVTVNGSPVAFQRTGDIYGLRLSIPARQVYKIRFLYENDLDLEREDVRKTGLYPYCLRIASDFRDLHLSRSRFGSALIREYYLHQWDKGELYLEEMWWLGIGLLALLLVGLWRLRWPGRFRVAIKRNTGSR